jgi:23S rRNA pseudouridine2605 synthase
VDETLVSTLLSGVELDDGPARAEAVRRVGRRVRLTLREGRKREVRRMLAACGHDVRRLRRVRYGPIELGELEPGAWRRWSTRGQGTAAATRGRR